MEKIQAAIAKARASRDRITGDGQAPAAPGATRVENPPGAAASAPAGAVQPVPVTPPVDAGEVTGAPADTAGAWAALSEFLPRPDHLLRHRVVSFVAGPDARPFDVIRTRMLHHMRTNAWRRAAITSAGAGCGKSVLALNLAFSLARQPEQRTILIETDFRQPSLARYLGLRTRHDVAQVFEGHAPFSDHAVRYGTNLAIATQSRRLTSPAEILQGSATGRALDQVAQDFAPTVMLFDMPPMAAGDDVMSFIHNVDAVLIVAGADMTTVKQLDQCERELATQCNVMGVVINKCRDETANYDYGY